MVTRKEKQNFSLIPYRRDNKWGYCNNKFNIKIPIVYDEALPFSEGYAAVRQGKWWGFIKRNGAQVIECKYQLVFDFSKNGRAIAYTKDLEEFLVINKKGDVIRSEKYDYKWLGKRKLTRSELLKQWEIEDELLSSNSDFITYFVYDNDEGKKKISELNTGYQDLNGKFFKKESIAEIKINKNEDFKERFVPVEINGKWNFIDKSWQLLFNDKINYAEFLDESSMEENDDHVKKGEPDDLDDFWKDFFSSTNSTLEQDGFDEVRNFSEGLAAIKIKDKWGFINTMGKVIIKCQYSDSCDNDFYLFRDGIAKVIDSNMNILFIDKTGNRYFEFVEDVLKRELNDNLTNNINSLNQYPLFFQAVNILECRNHTELKALLVEIIKTNNSSFKYDINTIEILRIVKKQVKSLITLFQKSNIISESIHKLIFSLVQYSIKINHEYYDLAYTEYYNPIDKQFFQNIEKDFILEILVDRMNSYFDRNELLNLFRLCESLQGQKEIEIKLKPIKYYDSVFQKFSLENSIIRTKYLLKQSNKSILEISELTFRKNSKSLNDKAINLLNTNKFDTISYQYRSLAILLLKQPKFFTEFISHNYPFNQIELDYWQEYLDWRLVSCNSRIQFDLNLIDHYKHRLFWTELSKNKTIHWSREILSSCISFLCRPNHILGNPISNISRSGNVKWSIAFIEEFKEKWDWLELSSNENLPWSDGLIKRFSPSWDWKSLCVNGKFWNEEIIASLENELDQNYERWNHLLSNPHIQLSKGLIYKYKEKWFSAIPFTGYHAYDVYENAALPWDEGFIELFKDKFNWYRLSESKILPWSENFINKFSQYWEWEALAKNDSIPWDNKLITKFEEKLSLTKPHIRISDKPSEKWNESLIDKNIDKINWIELSQNTNINWTDELIDKYSDQLYWNNFCRINKNWSEEIIDKFNELFYWDELANNKFFPWNLGLIKRFHSKMFNENNDSFNKHYLRTTDPKDLDYYENLYVKYKVFYGESIPKDLEYFNFLVDVYPDFKLKYPSNDFLFYITDEFDNSLQIAEINKLFNPILNKISINLLMNLIIHDNTFIKFLNEKETEKMEHEYKLAEKRSESESNYMSRAELVDLGYIDDDY